MTKNKINRSQDHKDFDIEMGKWLRKTRLSETYINPLTNRKMITTQSKLAKKLGVSFQQVQKYEKGLNVIGLYKFREMCVFFNKRPQNVLESIDVEIWKKEIKNVQKN
tara:strand:+ start:66 stop:389 length:324 start_codon:yes stop_codon:yes gene_type:complete